MQTKNLAQKEGKVIKGGARFWETKEVESPGRGFDRCKGEKKKKEKKVSKKNKVQQRN